MRLDTASVKDRIGAVPNWRECLCGQEEVGVVSRPSAAAIGGLAVNRWLLPRAQTRPEYLNWTREATWGQLTEGTH